MTRRSVRWVVPLVVLGLAFSCKSLVGKAPVGTPQADPKTEPKPALAAPVAATVTVSPDRVIGPVPRVFRPSAMLTGSYEEAKAAFLELPGKLGAVRWGLGSLLEQAASLDEYERLLEGVGPGAKRFEARGAQLVITLEGMPKWIASRQEDKLAAPYGWPIRKASPPRDFKAYEQFVYETVRILNGKFGLKPLYEFWNEPNSPMFWVGTQQELFKTYAAFAVGARRADPSARVGGVAVGSWENPREGESGSPEPLLKAFIRFAGSTAPEGLKDARLPLDFISWHCFARSPEEKWDGAAEIRGWLSAAGYDPNLPQVVDEWNRWSTFPEWYDLSRDSHLGAAYMAASMLAMDRAGVAYQAFANLQDFNDPPPGKVFVGDFGVLTRKPMVKKASFHVMHMMGLLEDARVDAQVTPEVADVEGVGVIAATGNNKLTVLIERYGGDETSALITTIRRAGFKRFSELGIRNQDVVAFYVNQVPLPANTPAKSRQALERAAENARKAKFSPASEVVLKLAIPGWERPARYTVYRVDDRNANPGVAYALAIKGGKSQNEAIAAARKMEAFAPATQGSGELPEIRLGVLGVVLVVLERN